MGKKTLNMYKKVPNCLLQNKNYTIGNQNNKISKRVELMNKKGSFEEASY